MSGRQDDGSLNGVGWRELQSRHAKVMGQSKCDSIVEMGNLKKLMMAWRKDGWKMGSADEDHKHLYVSYANYLEENNNAFGSRYVNVNWIITEQNQLRKIREERELFLRSNLIPAALWKILFSRQFVKSLDKFMEHEIQKVFVLATIYSQGYIPYSGSAEFALKSIYHPHLSKKYYLAPLSTIHRLLVSIGIQQIANYSQTNLKQVSSFELKHIIQFQKIVNQRFTQNQEKMNKLVQKIDLTNQLFNLLTDFQIQQSSKYQQSSNINKHEASTKYQKSEMVKQIVPAKLNQIKASDYNLQNYEFMKKRGLFHRNRIQYLESCDDDYYNEENEYDENDYEFRWQIEEMKEFYLRNMNQVIALLEGIPDFKYKLNSQQRQIVTDDGNLIVVGRSGTGKTTCALLRLFGVEFMLKKKQINHLLASTSQTSQKCQLAIYQQIIIGRNIFLTASPLLINEIKKQYKYILTSVKQRHTNKCKSCQQTIRQEQKQEKEREKLIDPLDLKNVNIQIGKIKQATSDSPKHEQELLVSGFYTIQHFIRMLDQNLERSFFNNESDKKQMKMDNDVRKNYINRYIYHSDCIILENVIEAAFVDYNFFVKHFWPKIPKHYIKCLIEQYYITPSIIWAQITSVLKGSILAHSCHHRYISLKMYFEEKRSVFKHYHKDSVREIKTQIYHIFMYYQNWCYKQQTYDFMDIVNHLLQETEFYGYYGPKINYMFIDEVQDLTSATIFLLSKMVINNIFYCGDTAQAITKGVDFRFKDIKYIYNHQYCPRAIKLEPPGQPINLTVNFRSHNEILQLANSIISVLEEIFPQSIDIIQKEQSDFKGPKPVLLINKNVKDIQSFFQLYSQSYQKDKKLSPQQIIIVRNEEQKLKIPIQFEDAVSLTPQSVKGLQYNEIILFNFFSSKDDDKWNVLDHLYLQEESIDKQIFQRSMKYKNIEERNYEEEQIMNPCQKQIENGRYKVKQIRRQQSLKKENMNYYYQLINELKTLYMIFTRARNILIIIDQKIPKSLTRIWQSMNLVSVIDELKSRQSRKWVEQIQNYKARNPDIMFESEQHWIKLGRQMFHRGQFRQAKKCFKNAHRQDLYNRVEAIQLERETDHALYNLDKQVDLRGEEAISNRRTLLLNYQRCACMFIHEKRFEDAANAYYKAQNIPQAKKFYLIDHCYHKAARCCLQMQDYSQSLRILLDGQLYTECLLSEELMNQWKETVAAIILNYPVFNQQKQALLFDFCSSDFNDFIQKNGEAAKLTREICIQKKEKYYTSVENPTILQILKILSQAKCKNLLKIYVSFSKFYEEQVVRKQNKIQKNISHQNYLNQKLFSLQSNNLTNELIKKARIYGELYSSLKVTIKKYDHHRSIQSKILSKLAERQDSRCVAEAYQMFDYLQILNCSLYLTNNHPQLLSLSLPLLFKLSLPAAKNYRLKRSASFANQQDFHEETSKMLTYFSCIYPSMLAQPIPRQSLPQRFYLVTLVDELVMGLLLQGHAQLALTFCYATSRSHLQYLLFAETRLSTKLQKSEMKKRFSNSMGIHLYSKLGLPVDYNIEQCYILLLLEEEIIIQKDELLIIQNEVNSGIELRITGEKEKLKRQVERLEGILRQLKSINYVYSPPNKLEDQQIIKHSLQRRDNIKKQLQNDRKIILLSKQQINDAKAQIQKFNIQIRRQKVKLQEVERQIQNKNRSRRLYYEELISIVQENMMKMEESWRSKKISISNKFEQDLIYSKMKIVLKDELLQAFAKQYLHKDKSIKKIQILESQKLNEESKSTNAEKRRQLTVSQLKGKQSLNQSLLNKCHQIKQKHQLLFKEHQNKVKILNSKIQEQQNVINKTKLIHSVRQKCFIENQNSKRQSLMDERVLVLKKIKFTKYQDELKKQNGFNKNYQKAIGFDLFLKIDVINKKNVDIHSSYVRIINSHRAKIMSIMTNICLQKVGNNNATVFNTIELFIYLLHQDNLGHIEGSIKTVLQLKQFERTFLSIYLQQDYENYLKNEAKYIGSTPFIFLKKVYRMISIVSQSSLPLIVELLRLYDCRIVMDCPSLAYLQRDFAFVKIGSPLINQIISEFHYVFDQHNTVVLCKTTDILSIILKKINVAIINIQESYRQKWEAQNWVISGRVNVQVLLDNYQRYKRQIQNVDVRLRDQLNGLKMKQIENISVRKQQLLSQFLRQSWQNEDVFFFIFHQLKEYDFVRQVYQRIDSIEDELLDQLNKKLTVLNSQNEKWQIHQQSKKIIS